MGLKDKLKQAVEGARRLRESRDPESYARYERDRDAERRRTEHERHDEQELAEHAREEEERTHEFQGRYAAEHPEREPPTRPDGS